MHALIATLHPDLVGPTLTGPSPTGPTLVGPTLTGPFLIGPILSGPILTELDLDLNDPFLDGHWQSEITRPLLEVEVVVIGARTCIDRGLTEARL